ncbi:MAG: hypothetical protein AAB759_03125, partial [Patescibacteria group bacterium]
AGRIISDFAFWICVSDLAIASQKEQAPAKAGVCSLLPSFERFERQTKTYLKSVKHASMAGVMDVGSEAGLMPNDSRVFARSGLRASAFIYLPIRSFLSRFPQWCPRHTALRPYRNKLLQ